MFRVSYAEGFQRPPIYGRVLTYQIDVTDTLFAQPAFHNLEKTERVRAAEFGIRRYSDRFTTDLLFFYQEGHNLARNGYLTQTDQTIWRYGYENAPGRAMSLWGIQGTIGDDILDFDLSKNRPEAGAVTAHLDFYFQYTRGREWFGYGLPATRDIRSFPRWMTQFRLSLRARKWEFTISSNRQNHILSSATVYQDFYGRETVLTKYPAYRTWDAMLQVYLSQNFLLYLHFKNLFNRHYAGIDATGTQDDLLYNPQPGRMFRVGVNYNMD
jgi:outer membrane receptor protein involved in Fe transport